MHEKTRFTYKPNSYTDAEEFYLTFSYYSCNNRIALQMYYYDSDFDDYLPYATLTVNIPDANFTNKNCVFIDINNCPFALHLLAKVLDCAKLTGKTARSGYCLYPELELNPDKLYKYIYYKE